MPGPSSRTHFRFFFAWEADKEELWLERMARDGWRLTHGGIFFRFVQSPPCADRYRLDYRTESGEKLRDYVDLCKDAGWEHVSRFAGWHYFRTSDPAAPELHSDPASLAERYKHLLALLLVIFGINVLFMLTDLNRPPRGRFGDFYAFFEWVRAALVALLAYAIYRIAAFIRELRRRGGIRV